MISGEVNTHNDEMVKLVRSETISLVYCIRVGFGFGVGDGDSIRGRFGVRYSAGVSHSSILEFGKMRVKQVGTLMLYMGDSTRDVSDNVRLAHGVVYPRNRLNLN